jgi:hypothetical protein
MWIDKQVYDFMIICHSDYEKGNHNYGKPKILKALGFELQEEQNPGRYNQVWIKDNVRVYSDGTYLHNSNNQGIYFFNYKSCPESSLSTYIDIPQELQYIGELSKMQLWRLMSEHEIKERLLCVLGVDSYYFMFGELHKNLKAQGFNKDISNIEPDKPSKLYLNYLNNLEVFGDSIANLHTIHNNMYVMSKHFSPYELYITPQCGEFEHHQKLLEKFTEINKSYIYEDEED